MTRWTLLIPTSQLFILNEWFPEIRLQSFEGLGTEQLMPLKTSFDYGVKLSQQTNMAKLKYKMEYGEKSFQDIINGLDAHVPDISFRKFSYVENGLRLSPTEPSSVCCKWKRESIQINKMKSLVVDGDYPNRDIALLIRGIQEGIESLPSKVKRRFRTSFMILETEPDLHDDADTMRALKHTKMLLINNRVKNWLLGDREYKPKG